MKKWMPDINSFYKIYSAESKYYNDSLSSLYAGKMYLSPPNKFNDKLEGFVDIDAQLFMSKCANYYPNLKDNYAVLNLLDAYWQEIDRIRNSFYIGCFCKKPPNLAMLYYYSQYKGIYCEFSLSDIVQDKYSAACDLDSYGYNLANQFYEIEYMNGFPQIDVDYLLSIKPENIYYDEKINETIKNALSYKNIGWQTENEVRIIFKKDSDFAKQFSSNIEDCGDGILIDFPFLNRVYTLMDSSKQTKQEMEKLHNQLEISYHHMDLRKYNGEMYNSRGMTFQEVLREFEYIHRIDHKK